MFEVNNKDTRTTPLSAKKDSLISFAGEKFPTRHFVPFRRITCTLSMQQSI